MIYDIIYSKKAEDDAAVLYISSPDDYKKFELIIEELKVHPRTGIGRPKRLHPKSKKDKNDKKWSRRINLKDRLVYQIHDQTVIVEVLSARGHYDDH